VGNRCCLSATGCESKRNILCDLVYSCVYCRVQLPCWVGVCEYQPDVLFVHQADVFFDLAECCVSECSEDIEAGFCLSVYVVCVRVESNFFLSYVTPSVVGVSV